MSEIDYLDAMAGLQTFLTLKLVNGKPYPAFINDMSIDGYIIVADTKSDGSLCTHIYRKDRLMELHSTYVRFLRGIPESPNNYTFAQWLYDTDALSEIEE